MEVIEGPPSVKIASTRGNILILNHDISFVQTRYGSIDNMTMEQILVLIILMQVLTNVKGISTP